MPSDTSTPGEQGRPPVTPIVVPPEVSPDHGLCADAATLPAALDRCLSLGFDLLPPEMRVRAFGVEYAHLSLPEGGDLYVTRHGWPFARQLLPSNWYADEWYARQGEKLTGSTGHVYHVPSRPVKGKRVDLVVKFSRVAQDVPIVVATSFPDQVPPEILAAARFNSPMEEFGLVMELRRGLFGPDSLRILTQRPFAIYAPQDEFQLWELGRSQSKFHSHRHLLAENQDDAVKAIELDIRRIYVMLYGWIKGRDAEQSWEAGDLSEQELRDLTTRVIGELRQKGFRVLDNKPKHFILRRRGRNGALLRRDGSHVTYGLVDFELLQRTPEWQEQYRTAQRERYRRLQVAPRKGPEVDLPSHLGRATVFGVDYVFGPVQDGGMLWIVGRDPNLFDYFVPDRWRRTTRVKLSPNNEVYRTRTRDHIHVVYRRSRVGSPPRVDPLTETARRVREHGYNSPFEEVVIAERLRELGIPTSLPRAIYRTGHPSQTASYRHDARRFHDHDHLRLPGEAAAPMLLPGYDYYTIWEYFRGFAPAPQADHGPGVDLEQARTSGLLNPVDCDAVLRRSRNLLARLGLPDARIEECELTVYPDSSGRPCLNDHGDVYANLGIDALSAYEIGALPEDIYRNTLLRLAARLRAADCEKLDLKGNHVLLALDVDGRFATDAQGELRFALCNFEFVRGLYRPIR